VKSARLERSPVAPIPEREAAWTPLKPRGGTWERDDGSVDSVQWIDLPGPGPVDLAFLEPRYFAWVPRLSAGFVCPRREPDGRLTMAVQPLHFPLAIGMGVLERDEHTLFRPIEGGMLAAPGGRIEFVRDVREDGTRLAVAVRSLRPRLPRWLYFRLQAQLHERSTFAFLREVALAWTRAGE
jgi:hypothetical protein